MSSVGQFGMSSSRVTESPVCLTRHKTPLLVSPTAVPHPHPPPVDDWTVASVIQFAALTGVVAASLAVALALWSVAWAIAFRSTRKEAERP
jgi:hypothetical protein